MSKDSLKKHNRGKILGTILLVFVILFVIPIPSPIFFRFPIRTNDPEILSNLFYFINTRGVGILLVILYFVCRIVIKNMKKSRSQHIDYNSSNLPQQIRELSELKNAGILSETEFEAKKQELLRKP